MFTASVSFDAGSILKQLDGIGADVQREAPAILQTIGVQILSFVKTDYETKGRGGTGTDGIAWDKIKRETAEAIARRLGPVRRMVERRKSISNEVKALLRTKVKRGGGKAKAAKLASLRKKRADLMTKINAEIDKHLSQHQTGVDTGLQRSSASPGFTAEGGGNVLKVQGMSVTIGFGREYSPHFDKRRKLMPETLPQKWQDKIDQLVQRRVEAIARKRLEG